MQTMTDDSAFLINPIAMTAKCVFETERLFGRLANYSLQETGSRVIAEAAASDTTWAATMVAFDDECASAIELLDLTLGDWEPEAYEGWTSI